jgi:hypothetical protein
MINKKNIDYFCVLSLWLIYLLFALKDMSQLFNNVKNCVMFVFCILIFWGFIQVREKEKFKKDFFRVSFIYIAFIVITIIKIVQCERYTLNSFTQIFKVWIPVFIAYCLLNILDYEKMQLALDGILVITFLLYILQNGSTILSEGLSGISFADSYSPLESNIFPSLAMGLLIYYAYFNENRWQLIISAIFVFLTFKRINVIFEFVLIIVPFFVDKNKHMPKIVSLAAKVVAPVGTILLYENYTQGDWDLIGEYFNWNLGNYSMGRNWFLKSLLSSGYESYGYYSSVDWNGQDIEMDLVRIFLELTIIGLCIIIWIFIDIAENHLYTMLVMAYCLVQCLVGHFIDSTYSWIVIYITIGMIKIYGIAESDLARKKKRQIKIKI